MTGRYLVALGLTLAVTGAPLAAQQKPEPRQGAGQR